MTHDAQQKIHQDRNPFFDFLYEDEKVSVYMDGNNFYGATRSREVSPDFGSLKALIKEASFLIRFNYYTVVTEHEEDKGRSTISVKPLIDWLTYNGFSVTARSHTVNSEDTRKSRRPSIDVDMAVDMLRDARSGTHHLIIFSGDGVLLPVIEEVKRMGCKVTVVALVDGVSDLVRRTADNFVDLTEILPFIRKTEKKAA